jgi:pimeloyl-ACP methyl ester carboxylesterase
MAFRTVRTDLLEIAYEEHGPDAGLPVILLHGFPDDVRAWDGVVPLLLARKYRVLVPWLRGYGPTRFLDPRTPRSGQQAALGADLRAFMDVLGLHQAVLGGYDWGGRAACVVAALWPERVRGLVSVTGYNIQDIAAAREPAEPMQEYRYWYQWYLHTPRGRAGLERDRRGLCRLMWGLWSPRLHIDDAVFERTAASFDNPDFVDVVVQSYRHRYGNAPGDPAFEPIERRLQAQPPIPVPTVTLHGATDGVIPPEASAGHRRHFSDFYRRELVAEAGHFLPREAPGQMADALIDIAGGGH